MDTSFRWPIAFHQKLELSKARSVLKTSNKVTCRFLVDYFIIIDFDHKIVR